MTGKEYSFSFCTIILLNENKVLEMMKLEYIPKIGFVFDGKEVRWRSSRNVVRENLGREFEEEDRMVDLSEYFEDGESHTIEQRRDFYHDEGDSYCFYLNYDEEDLLTELEVHSGLTILVNGHEMQFNSDIYRILVLMNDTGNQGIELEEGNYLFQDLKITIASSAATGGEGNGLAYFYGAENIEHLLG